MMKTLFKITLLALTVMFTSCKKNWTCTCQLKAGGSGNYEMAEKMKRKDAKALCESANVGPTSPYSSCGLK
jgi:hypothetical protein